jgi:tRNA U34 2-thiouridine synthase MnmA/TrmU
MKRVVIGLSGGVDSAVAAFALKRAGYDVCGLYMRNWDELDETGVCTGEQEERDARAVAARLGIAFGRVDFVKSYWVRVFDAFLADVQRGWTPNPDVLCNREIKFDEFVRHARALGADLVATGHYARVHTGDHLGPTCAPGDLLRLPPLQVQAQMQAAFEAARTDQRHIDHDELGARLPPTDPRVAIPADPTLLPFQCAMPAEATTAEPGLGHARLLQATDARKDQSYFLSMVQPGALDRVLFPLGGAHKHAVRALARHLDLPVADKPGSKGICFIGKRKFGPFLSQFLTIQPGRMRCIDSGRDMGPHQGVPFYSIGQSARVANQSQPYFVARKDLSTHTLWIAPGRLHPSLYASSAVVERLSFLTGQEPAPLTAALSWYCAVQTRRTNVLVPARVTSCIDPDPRGSGGTRRVRVEFAGPQFAITPGQVCAFYVGSECVGGGVIASSD